MNETLKVLKERRSVRKYKAEQIRDEELNAHSGGGHLGAFRQGTPDLCHGGGPGPGDHCLDVQAERGDPGQSPARIPSTVPPPWWWFWGTERS